MVDKVVFRFDAQGFVKKFRLRFERQLPAARTRFTEEVARQVLYSTGRFNPVDTARSRASWVTSLMHLGLAPPAGWKGSRSKPKAVAQGYQSGEFKQTQKKDTTTIEATSHVEYVRYLEYGTRFMGPFRMVRKSLETVGTNFEHIVKLLKFFD